MGGSEMVVLSPPKVCQFCKEEGHYASTCTYIGVHCPKAWCCGFMRVILHYNEVGTLETKFLKCSFEACSIVQEIYSNKEVLPSCQLCKEEFPLCKSCHLCPQCHLPTSTCE
ncbi:hypothetical protein IFM89_028014 [Coptis chinensis]|uniref:Uncharacterized protein n=1 Tax=Coptis chinensis TaxID=261450 RepID=A0A835HQP0_9MAGN|nr:hypothetical protein IFM89_028014 [Coptis chinensis]